MRRIKYEIDPNDKITGVKAISLVDAPAIESDFVAFSKEKPQYVELKIEGYKQVVAGLALIPEKDIMRVTPEGEKYLAYFTLDSIEKIRNKFHKELLTSMVNVDHSQQDYIDAYLIESFIIDSPERLADVTAKGIKNPIMGSWFVAYKIEDAQTFQRVLDGELKGFSVEIFVHRMFKAIPSELQEIKEAIADLKGHFQINGKDLMYVLNKDKDKVKLKSKGIFERKLKMIVSQIEN